MARRLYQLSSISFRTPDIDTLINQYGGMADRNQLPTTIYHHPSEGWSHPANTFSAGPVGTVPVLTILPRNFFVGW